MIIKLLFVPQKSRMGKIINAEDQYQRYYKTKYIIVP